MKDVIFFYIKEVDKFLLIFFYVLTNIIFSSITNTFLL